MHPLAYATPFTLPLFLLTILLLLSPLAHSATTTLLDPLGECYLNPNCLQDPKYPPLTVDTPIERGMPVKFENVSCEFTCGESPRWERAS